MKTVVNLTNHVYFNLDGHKHWSDLANQTVAIFADKYTPVGRVANFCFFSSATESKVAELSTPYIFATLFTDETAIPYGDIADVQGTNFDIKNGKYLSKENLAKGWFTVGKEPGNKIGRTKTMRTSLGPIPFFLSRKSLNQ